MLSQSTLEREFWRGELPGTGVWPPASDETRRDGQQGLGAHAKRLRHTVKQRLAA
ncbi:MAG: hypothetical protein CBARDCOR_0637 [uncultured Caballeronia sp.]|nr:MAG: hypothetical protein CBARDCOR_0637 [uncultured Caballeronia sp.]